MYRKVEDFEFEWKHASAGTLKALEAMTDEKLDQKITEDHNSLGWLGWHLTNAPEFFFGQIGLKLNTPGNPKEIPNRASEIVEDYKDVANQIATQVKTLTDDQLVEKVDLFGKQVPIGAILRTVIDHQTHHRGQMTVLLRQAGLKVPGVMGQTKEGN